MNDSIIKLDRIIAAEMGCSYDENVSNRSSFSLNELLDLFKIDLIGMEPEESSKNVAEFMYYHYCIEWFLEKGSKLDSEQFTDEYLEETCNSVNYLFSEKKIREYLSES